MGSLDSNGIWHYDNNDHVTPLATFMNLLSTSVSNAFNAFRTELTNALTVPDTGWVNLTVLAGWSPVAGYTPQVRRIGKAVYMRGRVATTSGSNPGASASPLNIPSSTGARPTQTMEAVAYAGSGNFIRLFADSSNGNISFTNFPSGSLNTIWISSLNFAID
jgi:hypothetical protein